MQTDRERGLIKGGLGSGVVGEVDQIRSLRCMSHLTAMKRLVAY